jgi:hypothetical protein
MTCATVHLGLVMSLLWAVSCLPMPALATPGSPLPAVPCPSVWGDRRCMRW